MSDAVNIRTPIRELLKPRLESLRVRWSRIIALGIILLIAGFAAPLLLGPSPARAAVPGSPGGLLNDLREPIASLVKPAHCRAVWHTHRRCVRWSRGGVCRTWRTWRHRC